MVLDGLFPKFIRGSRSSDPKIKIKIKKPIILEIYWTAEPFTRIVNYGVLIRFCFLTL